MKNYNLPEAKNKEWIKYYLKFISSRKEKGSRIHHILPRSFGGDNSSNNLIKLTDQEHYIAHMILWRAYRNTKTFWAFHMMLYTKGGNRERLNSKQYEKVRLEHSNFMKENNPMHRKSIAKKVSTTRKERFISGEIQPRMLSEEEKQNHSKRMLKITQ